MKSDRKQEDLEYAVYIPYYNTSKICFRHHDLPLFAINAILSLICDMLDVEPSTSKGITRDINVPSGLSYSSKVKFQLHRVGTTSFKPAINILRYSLKKYIKSICGFTNLSRKGM